MFAHTTSICSITSPWPQWSGLIQAEAEIQELLADVSKLWQGHPPMGHLLLPPLKALAEAGSEVEAAAMNPARL